ncbi:hypothetical protein C8R48DRAFT_676136 [Suillus tomentosus]|nr:hypothetical protein C8R48DRAFT_676136 [Suillus tomentosus]
MTLVASSGIISTSARDVIHPEEGIIEALFQECKIARAIATVLSEMLPYRKPEQTQESVIPTFLPPAYYHDIGAKFYDAEGEKQALEKQRLERVAVEISRMDVKMDRRRLIFGIAHRK